jgi:hypothetical protein
MSMNYNELIAAGNQLRAEHRPEEALKCYATALIDYPDNADAFNNYGNVIRECGFPTRGIPFLQNALAIDPGHATAAFNLAVCYLLAGDYAKGWRQYETRWNYEHLKGLLPAFSQPRWTGQELSGKTLLILGEQGHGDNIQFIRFVEQIVGLGAKAIVQVTGTLVPLFKESILAPTEIISHEDAVPEFDYWTPIMSLPGPLGITLENLPHKMQYLRASAASVQEWSKRLGKKFKLRIGFAWSGRRDSWINQHKAMPFDVMLALIKSCPEYEWYNLQLDCTPEEEAELVAVGVKIFPGTINSFADTAGLVSHMDVVIAVDTAMAHLAGSLGRPVWIPLNQFGQDWRWLLNREDSPWYASARLFRQPARGDWNSVTARIQKFLTFFKI